MIKKYIILLFVLFASISTNAQFDDHVSKTILFDDALNIGVYVNMLAKDKLYQIKHLKKKLVAKEIDYALAKVNESISEIDLEETNPQIRVQIEKIKEFWVKFNEKATADIGLKEFSNIYFEINVFNKLVSDLTQSMIVAYDLNSDDIQNYKDIQELRRYIQIISVSYYANLLNLNKSFMHEYQKNTEKINTFIIDKSNTFLNDPIIGTYFPEFIKDWNFLKNNLQHPTYKNPKTVFSMSISIDYHLKQVKDALINKLNKQ